MITKHDGITVSQFVKQLKDVIDHHPSFNNVTLIGELSNFKAHSSGHFYFTLKDEGSRINCVMFKSSSQKVLFHPKDGDKVLVSGKIEVYITGGTIQMYASRMNLDGLGDLHIQYENLKKKFFDIGYFDPKHKKSLPKYPQNIAVIVGAGSAAYHDINKTLSTRWPLANVHYEFSAVQGKEAISNITEKIAYLNSLNFDAIILARGGGSIEDLWAFNEEAVVNAVFHSKIPLISGVGHESDVTLVDYVSDLRAATPTAAAVALTPDIVEVKEDIRNFKNTYYSKVKAAYQRDLQRLSNVINTSKLKDPVQYIERKQMNLDVLHGQILRQIRHFEVSKSSLTTLNQQMLRSIDSKISTSNFNLTLIDNKISMNMNNSIDKMKNNTKTRRDLLISLSQYLVAKSQKRHNEIDNNSKHIIQTMNHRLNLKKTVSVDIMRRISSNNPLEKMISMYDKGMALITADEMIVKSVDNVSVGDTIKLQLRDGNLDAKIIRKVKKHGKI